MSKPATAVVSLALLCIVLVQPCPAAADVEVIDAVASHYHFAYARIGTTDVVLLQHAPPAPPIMYDDGVFKLSVTSICIPQTTPSADGWQVSMGAMHSLSATVSPSVPDSYAEVGAGVAAILFTLRVTDGPVVYAGGATIYSWPSKAERPPGTVLPPGDHTLFLLRVPMPVDAFLSASRGESNAITTGAAIHLDFEPAEVCPVDWDANTIVDSADISAFIQTWLAAVPTDDPAGDFNLDGLVTSADISAFITAWIHAVQHGC